MVTIRRQLVSSRDKTFSGKSRILGIAVHETANRARGANAAAHANLQANGNVRSASWQWTVDDKEAVQSYPHDVRCWHAGDGESGLGSHFIAIEICVNEDGDYEKALQNAAELIQIIRAEENLPRESVKQHFAFSGKNCPAILRSRGKSAWDAFVARTDPKEGGPVIFVSPAEGRLTSHWGPRKHPVTGVEGYHRGMDIAPLTPGKKGTPVYACYGGVVTYVSEGVYNKKTRKWEYNRGITNGWNSGSLVVIQGPGGGSEAYGHLEGIKVKKGQRVKAGDLLGYMSDIGNVTGVHLHLEMWNGPTQGDGSGAGNTRNPMSDFALHGIKPGSKPEFPKSQVKPLPVPNSSTPSAPTTPQEEDIMKHYIFTNKDRQYWLNPRDWTIRPIEARTDKGASHRAEISTIVKATGDELLNWRDRPDAGNTSDELGAVGNFNYVGHPGLDPR